MICTGLDLKYWDFVKDEITRSFQDSFNRADIDKLKEDIEQGKAQLWAAHDGSIKAILVTEIASYHNLRAVRVLYIVGQEMDSWFDMACETIGNWAKSQGCSVMEATGRMGWSRYLDNKGFTDKRMMMSKAL
jgi:hypothetical protein